MVRILLTVGPCPSLWSRIRVYLTVGPCPSLWSRRRVFLTVGPCPSLWSRIRVYLKVGPRPSLWFRIGVSLTVGECPSDSTTLAPTLSQHVDKYKAGWSLETRYIFCSSSSWNIHRISTWLPAPLGSSCI